VSAYSFSRWEQVRAAVLLQRAQGITHLA